MTYLLDNVAAETQGRFAGLEACFDATTFRYLTALGIGPGWRCWELGAGSGSVSRWMAARVGDEGSVLTTDINLDWIDRDMPRQVEIRHHDVATDQVLPSAYELIHARLVLLHLPQRDVVIQRLISALAPGGWLVLEEFDQIFPPCPEGATDEQRTFTRVREAFSELLQRRGADTSSYPRTLPWRLKRAGLIEVGAEGRLIFVQGGTPGAAIQRANLLQTGGLAVQSGLIAPNDLTTFVRLLDDPKFMFAMPLMVSAWGRRQPQSQPCGKPVGMESGCE
jgi:SAM-dependent methyltransferase